VNSVKAWIHAAAALYSVNGSGCWCNGVEVALWPP